MLEELEYEDEDASGTTSSCGMVCSASPIAASIRACAPSTTTPSFYSYNTNPNIVANASYLSCVVFCGSLDTDWKCMKLRTTRALVVRSPVVACE